ncbi:MAG TPA: tagaturonate epimerase family protein [Verrucomicrobiota bacterium]|nr:tagaturonate epimerase family protein [Verrucomicrobiota bacterium]HPU55356.1 tagaturonate epimerase family protein [Verrucomicrobiota bacterium]
MLKIAKYSVGVGDRFAQQAEAQLQACRLAADQGVDITPVWNKSNREHLIVNSEPSTVRAAAEAAVRKLGWTKAWHVDADHIRLETVDRFIPHSDFFTIDVADSIGKPAKPEDVKAFADRHPELAGRIDIPGVEGGIQSSRAEVERIANKFLFAVQEAGVIYRHIEKARGADNFITEVSMDETDSPQTPVELLVILVALADEKVPLQTVAPKFTGRFNKGVDYIGNVAQFEKEFNEDLAVIRFAIEKYGLPDTLKLSVHSGSDKFSIYGPIHRAIKRHNAGLHLKTAGTTWLEEIIGLAEAGGDGLALAKEIYAEALAHTEELCAPYAAVIDIDRSKLPPADVVAKWSAAQLASAVRHDPRNPEFNLHIRQLLHVGYKVAAKKGQAYLNLVRSCEATIAKNVTGNLFDRHIKPVFLGA